MKILIVLPYSLDVPGGVASQVLGEAEWLNRRGHHVQVVAPGTHRVQAQVPVTLLGAALPVAFNGSVARLAVLPHQIGRALALLAVADIVHVHEPLTPGLSFAAASCARRLVVTHHASYRVPAGIQWLLRRRSRRLGLRRSIAVSPTAATTALAVTGHTPTIIPNALAVTPAPPARVGKYRGVNRPRVGFLGRAGEPRKGFNDFVQCVESLGGTVTPVAAGPGTDRQPWGYGLLPESERRRFLESCDVLVAPNRSGESFGLVALEAMAAGCAVLASDLPAFRFTLAGAHQAGVVRFFPAGQWHVAAQQLAGMIHELPDPLTAHNQTHQWAWDTVGPRVEQQLESAQVAPSSTLDL